MICCSKEDILEIYRQVLTEALRPGTPEGSWHHSEFVLAFAKAILEADNDNFLILLGPALYLIEKYQLQTIPPYAL